MPLTHAATENIVSRADTCLPYSIRSARTRKASVGGVLRIILSRTIALHQQKVRGTHPTLAIIDRIS